jgi:hypothetical protein
LRLPPAVWTRDPPSLFSEKRRFNKDMHTVAVAVMIAANTESDIGILPPM